MKIRVNFYGSFMHSTNILPFTSRYRCQASLLNNLSMHSYLVIQVTTTMAKSRWLDSQSRKNRGCLSLISNMKMQFSVIWAALKKWPKKVMNYKQLFSSVFFYFRGLKSNLKFFKGIVASTQKSWM